MPRRSILFTPGDRPEMMRKAPGAGSDVVVFDLEDAVAPGRKAEARDAIREVLSDSEFDPDCEVCVRVNANSEMAAADLDSVLDGLDSDALDSVMLPKAAAAGDVDTLTDSLRNHEYEVPVLALIETAAGVLAAADIAAVDATDALIFGAEDLAADLGATRTNEGTEVLYAREHVVLAAAAAGVDAIDTVHTDIEDVDGLAAETEFAIELGYDGKLAIHPVQVDPINDAFTPHEEQVEWARRVLDAQADADAEDRGVFRVDGEMVDAPLIAQAERVLALADAASEE